MFGKLLQIEAKATSVEMQGKAFGESTGEHREPLELDLRGPLGGRDGQVRERDKREREGITPTPNQNQKLFCNARNVVHKLESAFPGCVSATELTDLQARTYDLQTALSCQLEIASDEMR